MGAYLNGNAYADGSENVARREAEGRNPGVLLETDSPDFARQLLLHCSTSCVPAVVRYIQATRGDYLGSMSLR